MKYKNELNIFTYRYMPLRYWRNWFTNIRQFFRNIKFAFQRAYRGYADCDTWNIDVYLANLIPQMLLYLSNNGCSYPIAFNNREEWEEVLKEISEHFHNTLEWGDDIPLQKEAMDVFKQMSALPKDSPEHQELLHTWLESEQRSRYFREDEKNLALDMLKIFYFDMWD